MLTRMTRMARMLTHMLTRMTRWLAYYTHSVEGVESAIRNAECGIRNPFSFVIGGKSFRIYNIFLFLFF